MREKDINLLLIANSVMFKTFSHSMYRQLGFMYF